MGKDKGYGVKFKIIVITVYFLCLLVISPSAFAHKVNIFAYVEGDTVYTESYFPDGKKVKGGIIEVYDNNGEKLLEGVTDNEGKFNFKPTKKDDLKIVVNASLGHRNSYILSQHEFSAPVIRKHTRLKKDRISYKDVIAGIGYIFGITGVAFYFLNKRKKN